MGYIGTDQTSGITEILERAKKFLLEGKDIMINIVEFGPGGKEHDPLEYELYVLYDD